MPPKLPALIDSGDDHPRPGKPPKHGKRDLAHSPRKAAEHYQLAAEYHRRAAGESEGSAQAMVAALLALGQAADGERHARDAVQVYATLDD